jgi:S-formylglutathione hydrolase
MSFERLNEYACFDGTQGFYAHASETLNCRMQLGVFVPPAARSGPVPVLYFLSGLTSTEQNFTTKAGAQRYAAEHGLILVAPDTSPRGLNLPGEDDAWDFGSGASFYVDATQAPWNRHYKMYSYVTRELPELAARYFPVDPERQGISGHSMGGHGALVCALRNPERFRSCSALAPIAAPSQCPWGQKAFSGYLGPERSAWAEYDATELVRHGYPRPILIDQGAADAFLAEQLKPELFAAAAAHAGSDVTLRLQPGYDHSYYFVSTFIGDHVAFHAARLGGRTR